MNLNSHHRRLEVVHSYRRVLVALNSPCGLEYCDKETAHRRVLDAVLDARPDADRAVADEMIWALWECDD